MYNESIAFCEFVTKCVALALVPLDDIPEYFLLAEQYFESIEDDLPDEASDFFNYFTRTYVGKRTTRSGIRKKPLFAHASWNKYAEILSGAQTTSNRAEAYNGALATRSDNKPSYWSTLDAFKREEALTARKYREEMLNTPTQPPMPGCGTTRQILQRNKDERIRAVCKKANLIPKSEYLNMLVTLIADLK